MNRLRIIPPIVATFVVLLFPGVNAAAATNAPAARASASLNWIPFPDARLEIRGLPWFKENAPELWRLPGSASNRVPKGVWARAVAPDGGRIRFASDTTRLVLRVQVLAGRGKPCFFDAYVDGQPAGSARVTEREPVELMLFENKDRVRRNITIYLPNNHEARVLAVGVDDGAGIKAAPAFALPRPLVCYGSSVLQGTGATHPAQTYPAILARRLNLDFVNLGFGGAGKAETNVVQLVKSVDACAVLLDLGKSYGAQSIEPYARMLDALRAAHPEAPIFCVTPIYSIKEAREPGYRERSEDLRTLMRQAAADRIRAGDRRMFVVEGLDLFGAADEDTFADLLHPNDAGNERMAARLEPVVRAALFDRDARP